MIETESRHLLEEIRACRLCEALLPLGPRPIVQFHPMARLLIIGQAPGRRVHESGIHWNDPSGDRLREWLHLDKAAFYDERLVAVMPMGFCYPGKSSSGDRPPRPECAPQWHDRLLAHLPKIELTLLIGTYAQRRYLGDRYRENLTATVRAWRDYLPTFLPLPHPSPRNRYWLAKNPWFEQEVIPALRARLRHAGLPLAEDRDEPRPG